MASVRKEIIVNAPADKVWAALADFQAVHTRLAGGFVTNSVPDGDGARMITFANGTKAREILVDIDPKAHRLVYSVASERLKHHNASAQIFAEGRNQCRFVWLADFLPNEFRDYIDGQMEEGAVVMKRNLEAS